TRFCQRKAGRGLHLQPAAELVVFAPDAAYFRAAVTRYQGRSLAFHGFERTIDDKCTQTLAPLCARRAGFQAIHPKPDPRRSEEPQVRENAKDFASAKFTFTSLI